MQSLYENGYKEDIENPDVAKMYDDFCKEQEHKKEEEKRLAAEAQQKEDAAKQAETIKLQNEAIINHEETISKQAETIKQQKQTIASQNEKNSTQSDTIAEQEAKIAQQNSIIEEQNRKIAQMQAEHVLQDRNMEQGNSELEALRKQVEELQKTNSKQLIVIEALNKRTQFLENLVRMQEKCINSIMANFRAAKKVVSETLVEIKPKKFMEKLAARFTRRKEIKLIGQAEVVSGLENEAENEYETVTMSQQGVSSTNDYVRQYIRDKKANEPQKQQDMDLNKF